MKYTTLKSIAENMPCSYGVEAGSSDINLPVSKVSNIDAEGNFHREFEIRGFTKKEAERYTSQDGDLLVVKSSGSKTNILSGKTAICTAGHSGKLVSSNFLLRLRVNKKKANPRFLWYFLNSGFSKAFVKKVAGTTTYPNLKWDTYSSHPVPALPASEQKRIAEILDKADAIRRKRQQAIQLADEFLRSVFLDMFGDPVSNPRGWKTTPIRLFGKVVTGNTPSRKRPEYYGDHIEWIKSDNINTPSHFLTSASEYLSESGRAVARTVPEGSILVTCIAGSRDCIGNAAIADREVAFNQQINAIIPNDNVTAWFLYGQLLFAKPLVQSASTNSMKGMVSKSKFEQIELLSPPDHLQRKFVDIFQKHLELTEKLRTLRDESLEAFSSISQRAFRGDL
ncbi:MAG: hypothetical protein B6D72_16990 [gamma proteobacterium symbiont of Ctena orbiculata]|nr:MAG: hypothetical protein B6D72_16990 [gamma proteobacterium symbiont of Ctena orbiculata]